MGRPDRLLNGAGFNPLLRDGVGDHFAVRGGMENGAVQLQLLPQFGSVGQVAVVAQCHGAAAVPDDHGLGVGADAGYRRWRSAHGR